MLSICLVYGFVVALWWLCGGFVVALGGSSRLFDVRSSRFKVRGSVLTISRSPQRLEVGEGFLVGKLIPGQLFIRSRHIAGLQSKLLKHEVSRHGNAHRLVEREVTRSEEHTSEL